jgi:hypothetical protein
VDEGSEAAIGNLERQHQASDRECLWPSGPFRSSHGGPEDSFLDSASHIRPRIVDSRAVDAGVVALCTVASIFWSESEHPTASPSQQQQRQQQQRLEVSLWPLDLSPLSSIYYSHADSQGRNGITGENCTDACSHICFPYFALLFLHCIALYYSRVCYSYCYFAFSALLSLLSFLFFHLPVLFFPIACSFPFVGRDWNAESYRQVQCPCVLSLSSS